MKSSYSAHFDSRIPERAVFLSFSLRQVEGYSTQNIRVSWFRNGKRYFSLNPPGFLKEPWRRLVSKEYAWRMSVCWYVVSSCLVKSDGHCLFFWRQYLEILVGKIGTSFKRNVTLEEYPPSPTYNVFTGREGGEEEGGKGKNKKWCLCQIVKRYYSWLGEAWKR